MPDPSSSLPPGRRGAPTKPALRRLVEAKRKWHYTPDSEARRLGFRGWHQRGYLPHFDAPGVTQLLTINLADAFPVTRRAEWEPILKLPDESVRRRKLEAWLDRGHGQCWLSQQRVAKLIEESFLAEHRQLYALRAWVIMPNHLHAIVDVWRTPLSVLVKKWKGATSRQ